MVESPRTLFHKAHEESPVLMLLHINALYARARTGRRERGKLKIYPTPYLWLHMSLAHKARENGQKILKVSHFPNRASFSPPGSTWLRSAAFSRYLCIKFPMVLVRHGGVELKEEV